ncbi:hypothetical protein B0H21DRAFT_748568 [Amylocystis lapponica]|nr:hypothetical protein B0H21DRAFT_748568 [Amylocystis lapponica]
MARAPTTKKSQNKPSSGRGRKRVVERPAGTQNENVPPPARGPPNQVHPDDDVAMGNEEEVSRAALEAKIRELEAQLTAAKAAKTPASPPVQVPRPKGTAGQSYNLQEAMGLEDNYALYSAIRGYVRNLVRASRLNKKTRWNRQPIEIISKIFKLARKEFPILARYAHDWPADEFAKAYLKRTRAHCKKTHQDDIIAAASREFRHSVNTEEGDGDVEMDEP